MLVIANRNVLSYIFLQFVLLRTDLNYKIKLLRFAIIWSQHHRDNRHYHHELIVVKKHPNVITTLVHAHLAH